MSIKQKGAYCPQCQKRVLAQGVKPNHLLHLLLTIFTGGLWGIVWLIITVMSAGNYRCTQCGTRV
ncbi:hypothetical protein GCM10023174_14180 [Chelativorans composti]|jgi:hypothetical protein|uniref:LITAF domain-containing protein n=1 Tax=Chelativorans composti TaxID=768533 RepID=A0ABW5DCS2_9HYPH